MVITAIVLRFFIGTRVDSGMTKKQKKMPARILIAAAMLLGLQFLPAEVFAQIDAYLFPSAGRWVRFALYLVDYFIIGYDILRKAIKGILNRQVFDENFLMAVATVGARAILPPLVRMLAMGLPADWGTWVYRALTFLVISCPCALAISIPLSFFAGIGGASQESVLVKGFNYLEILSQTKGAVFDKTGTLTQGVFEVNDIHHNEMENAQLIEYASLLAESASSHPIGKSLQLAYGKERDRSRVSGIQEISGNGIIAKDGHAHRRREKGGGPSSGLPVH